MLPDNMPPRRRGKTKTRRRRFRGVNLWNAAESLVQANILTQNFFGADPLAFLIGKTSTGYGGGRFAISNVGKVQIGIGELFGTTGQGEANRAAAWNYMKQNWWKAGLQIGGARLGFAVAKKLTRGMRSQLNNGVRMVGLQNEVRV